MLVTEQEIKNLKDYREFIDAIRHNIIVDLKQLSEITNSSWSTAKKYVSELIDLDIVRELSDNEIRSTGKRYYINPSFGYFISIALGSTQVKLTITNFDFEPENLFKNLDFKEYLDRISDLFECESTEQYLCCNTKKDFVFIQSLCSKVISEGINFFKNSNTPKRLLGIGISLPGLIDWDRKEIIFCPNLTEIEGCNIESLIRKNIWDDIKENNLILNFSHDTVAALVHEKERLYINNIYTKAANIACLYMGSGLGASYIIQNCLVTGANHSAGEIGHLDLYYSDELVKTENKKEDDDKKFYAFKNVKTGIIQEEENKALLDNKCKCGKAYCLEHLIRLKVFNSNTTEDFLNKTTNGELNTFAENHPYRYKVLKYFISQILNITINMLNVDLIVLTGRIFNGIPELYDEIEGLKISSSLKSSSKHCQIIKGSPRLDTTAIGAAILTYYSLVGDPFNIKW